MIEPGAVHAGFARRFPGRPRLFRAPGRVNLIGEHTDYNGGFVMPAAIEFGTIVAAAPRTDRKVEAYSRTLGERFIFDLDETPPGPINGWGGYVAGTAYGLRDGTAGPRLAGANLFIDSDVPLGAGLSSSAALEVAVAYALLAAAGAALAPLEIALACQRAENDWVGVRSGIMDQYISCFGEAGHALMLDCRSLGHIQLPLPPNVSLVIANTRVKHSLAGGEYNERRADCEQGARALGVGSLREVPAADFAGRARHLPERVFRRCRHVVTENARVERAAAALSAGDCARFGELMNASHTSLDEDYEVSCPELNVMVELARRVPGVYGARMTGGGFGGCTINLVETAAVQRFRDEVAPGYRARTGITPEIYVSAASAGAREVRAE